MPCRVRRIRFRHALSSWARHRASERLRSGRKSIGHPGTLRGTPRKTREHSRPHTVTVLVSKKRAASCVRKVTNTPVSACKASRFAGGRKNRVKKNTISLYGSFARNCNDSHRGQLQRARKNVIESSTVKTHSYMI